MLAARFVTFADGSRFYFPDRLAKPLPHSFSNGDPAMMVDDATLDVIDRSSCPAMRSVLPKRRCEPRR